jgi:hypothetical protein
MPKEISHSATRVVAAGYCLGNGDIAAFALARAETPSTGN